MVNTEFQAPGFTFLGLVTELEICPWILAVKFLRLSAEEYTRSLGANSQCIFVTNSLSVLSLFADRGKN